MTTTRLFTVAAALALFGCARAAVDPATAPCSPGPSQILLEDSLPWPYRLDRIEVWLDGVLLYRGADRERPIAVLPIPPGDHSVQAFAVASFRLTPFGQHSCPVFLRAVQGLRFPANAAGQAARVWVRLGTTGVSSGFVERLALGVRADGAQAIAHHPLADLPGDAALPDTPEAALEGLQARLEQARERRDATSAACYRDKVEQALSLMRVRERRDTMVQGSERRRAVDRAIGARILRAYAESTACEERDAGGVRVVRAPDPAAPACALGQQPAELAGPTM